MNNDTNLPNICKSYLSQDRHIKSDVLDRIEQAKLIQYHSDRIDFVMKDLQNNAVWVQQRFLEPIEIYWKEIKSKTMANSNVWYFYETIDFSKPVIIVEGEIDRLSASHLDNIIWLQWISNLKKLIEQLKDKNVKTIYILTDADQASDNAIGSLFSFWKEFLNGIYDARWILNWMKDVNVYICREWDIQYKDIELYAKPLEEYLVLINSLIIRSGRGSVTLNHNKISLYFMGKYNIKTVDGNVFQYQWWIWKLINSYLVQKMIVNEVTLLFNLLMEQIKVSDKNSIYDMLLSNAYDEELKKNLYLQENSCINLKDWIYDPVNKTIIPYQQEHYKIQKFNYPYKIFEWYQDPIKRLTFLDQILDWYDNKEAIILFLQEFIGYCITSSTRFEKALLMFWSWANGKGVFLSVIKNILWEENCSSIWLHEINNPQNLYTLFAKLANIETDLQQGVQLDWSVIKKIISWEKLLTKPLYKQPLEFSPVAKLLVAANELPMLKSIDLAIKRRFVFLELRKTFYGKEDPLLTQKLITEKENIFVWAVKWLERLLTRWTFDIPSELQDIVDQFIKDNDPIVWFLDDHNIVPGNQIRISNADMYSEFCWYCKNNWLRNVAKNIFTKNLKLRWFQEFRDTNRRWLLISRK